MKLLEDRIRTDGVVRPGKVLAVDSFLNHQIDTDLLQAMARQRHVDFADAQVNKVLTVEASGIAIACFVGAEFGVPVVFAKRSWSKELAGDMYTARVHSYTHNSDADVMVSRRYLGPDDRVLLVDDFLANGCAMEGLVDICRQADAAIEGVAIAIEKGFQPGGSELRAQGLRVDSLAVIDRMDVGTGEIFFRSA